MGILKYVSILVLMDYHFLFDGSRVRRKSKKCFNPCFNGLSFLISKFIQGTLNAFIVSILVLMDYHFLC